MITVQLNHRTPDSRVKTDVAIVGLGAAGAFAAYLLRQNWSSRLPKVIAYEAQDRVGGRLHSPSLPRIADALNLGGMRFDQNHQTVTDYLEKLGIGADDFDIGNKDNVTAWRVRGTVFRGRQFDEWPCSAYNLHGDARSVADPSVLIRYVISRALKDTDFPDLSGTDLEIAQQWRDQVIDALDISRERPLPIPIESWRHVWHGWLRLAEQNSSVPLWGAGFSNLLVRYLGSEGLACVRDALGFDSVIGNWNAAAAMAWIANDFGAKVEWKTPHGGFQELPKQLIKRFTESGGHVNYGYRLMRLNKYGEKRWRLLFECADEIHEAIARHVILALPPKALQELPVGYIGWNHAFVRDKLESVRQHRMFKAILVYPNAWWDPNLEFSDLPGVPRGRIFTDSPLRQVYYFGRTTNSEGSPDGLPSLMTYSDGEHVDYWATFLNPPPDEEQGWGKDRDAQIQQYVDYWAGLGKGLCEDDLQDLQALKPYIMPWRMQYKMRELLAELHGVPEGKMDPPPPPLLGVYQGWGLDSLNVGGWHTWRIGTHPEKERLIDAILQPFPGEQLYIVGEAYSSFQGWVQGALDSASDAVNRLKMSWSTR